MQRHKKPKQKGKGAVRRSITAIKAFNQCNQDHIQAKQTVLKSSLLPGGE
jgi:hypothetical protein